MKYLLVLSLIVFSCRVKPEPTDIKCTDCEPLKSSQDFIIGDPSEIKIKK